ncbi:phosphorothioated DNA-binding restriction endonuclease [Bacillus sp. Marseille-P3661]|uniref:phosphorothioated DNA-binding restriction endonuclease n=1 Tax=Bacillus sp. Marseille-P3661 TaxID=1936234 RepID=UPI000C85395B|nr:HNH endonuclease [Bacillus sp. Marseille-P3661]
MNLDKLVEEIDKIKLHKQKKIGASLKKPLLLLLLISLIEGKKVNQNKFHFTYIEKELDSLIRMFGGRSGTSQPEQPFHHLNSSIIWDIHVPDGVQFSNSKTLPRSILRDPETYGYFNDEVYQLLQSDQVARIKVIQYILEKYWPETVQSDLRELLNLPFNVNIKKRNRNFMYQVLANYRHKCAVCGFSSLFNQVTFGIDAAHIYWHAYGGPDEITNGLALCKLHHWALDRGVFTIDPVNFEIIVSGKFVAQDSKSIELLEVIKGQKIDSFRDVPPDRGFIEWHNDNVFVV